MDRITVTDLARYAGLYVDRARSEGRPVVVTHHGEDVAVLVSVEMYERMVRRLEPEQLALPLDEQGAA